MTDDQHDFTMQLLAQAMASSGGSGSPLAAFLTPIAGAAIGKKATRKRDETRAAEASSISDTLLNSMMPAGIGGGGVTQSRGSISWNGENPFAAVEQQYGLPPGYLALTAHIESGMDPNAKNPNSSAGGLFQFIDSTASTYGLSDRFDPAQATDAAARLAVDNANTLRRALGREPTAAELYLAHQQGAGGASKLLANPDALASSVVGVDAVRLNGGDPNMTAGQFANLWLGKFNDAYGAGAGSAGGGAAVAASGPGAPASAPGAGAGVDRERAMQLLGVMNNPNATNEQKSLAAQMLDRMMTPSNPMDAIKLETAQLELERLRNPGVSDATKGAPAGHMWADPSNPAAGVIPIPGHVDTVDPTTDQRNYQFYAQQEIEAGREPVSFNEWGLQSRRAGATTVNVGDGAPGLGKLSTDYAYIVDPETGKIKLDPQGLPMAAPVPGSPAAQAIAAANDKGAMRADQAMTSAEIVREDIGRAKEQVANGGIMPVTGAAGSLLSNIGGTGAHDLQQTILTIQANVGFDRLQQMREASPTGGALGSITERELATLQAVMGSLAQSQSRDQLLYNLDRLDRIYSSIMEKAAAYPNSAEFGFGAVPGAPVGSAPAPGPVQIGSRTDYDALPPGAEYIDPEGNRRRKP
ncbi:transglycosylase SLT domain-containing protein [Pseudogemmobacter sonorensis]|uniref:transglycosylase SLT domain-containing protein n=1 Tax=Pseudogemmobacter sonorensis TaxID=2989681 RepID=UPI00368EE5C9